MKKAKEKKRGDWEAEKMRTNEDIMEGRSRETRKENMWREINKEAGRKEYGGGRERKGDKKK